MKYGHLKLIQGGDDYDEFEDVAYPDREGISVGFPDYEKAQEYLMQFEHGEDIPDSDIQTEYPYIWGHDYENVHETDTHVMIWNVKRGDAAIWRKIED